MNEGFDDAGREFSLPSEIVPAPRMSKLVTHPVVDFDNRMQVAAEEPDFDMKRYVHAVRRNWLLGVVLGILAGVPIAGLIWFFFPIDFTATEFVRISPIHTPLVFETAGDTLGRPDFKSFKNTQKQLLMQPLALSKALQDPEVAKLKWVRENPDALAWLQKELEVTFPFDAEIMNVSLPCSDPVVAHRIVNALVDNYMKDIVEKEREERQSRVSKLEEIMSQAEEKVRKKRGLLIALVDSLGTGDASTLNVAQQSTLQTLTLLRADLSKINFELMRIKGEVEAKTGSQAADQSVAKTEEGSAEKKPGTDNKTPATNSAAEAAGNPKLVAQAEPRDARLEEALENDPAAAKITKEIERLQTAIKQAGVRYDARTAAGYITKYKSQLEEQQQKLAERTKRIERLFQEGAVTGGPATMADHSPIKIAVLEKQALQLREEIKGQEAEAKKYGKSSIDVEMMRKEIDDLDPVVTRVSQEIERTKIELQSNSRITRYKSNGIPPATESKKRLPITIAGGILGFLAPLALLVMLDSRKNHVNNVDTINSGVKISVLGTIPRVPARVMRRLNDASHAGAKQWRERVSESVTALTAMLLRKVEVEGHRVILVSSAVPGEGKSTLAEQLARSLADSGHRTLLIDFDLRRPQLHRRFNVAIEPGVCDVLRQDSDLQSAVRETSMPNLGLLTSGLGVGSLLRFSTSGMLATLFQQCREEYEIIIVDSSPLLPVVDGRVVGQHTDGALLTVVKDTSQVSQVTAARNILCDYGIPVLGCVVTGDDNASYYSSYAYSAETEGALQRGIAATRSMSAM